MNEEVKISVIIVTYNQQDLLGRCIDSVLFQNEHLYEIVICDDHSTDKTWDVIETYQQNHPDLIRGIRNTQNLGIFKNFYNGWQSCDGNIATVMAGDDELLPDCIDAVYDKLINEKVDCDKESVSVFGNYIVKTPSGKEIIRDNSIVSKCRKYNSLKLRDIISNFGTFATRPVFSKFYPINENIGLFTDGLWDIQLEKFTQKCYHINVNVFVHYTDIGITSKVPLNEQFESYIQYLSKVGEIISLNASDKRYIKYKQNSLNYTIYPTWMGVIKCVYLYIISRDLEFGIKNNFSMNDLRLVKDKVRKIFRDE